MDSRQRDRTTLSARGSSRELIAIVDDEPMVLRTLERMLSNPRWEVVTAGSAAGVEAWLSRPELRVVLLDLRIGDESGLDVLETIRARRPEVQVVMITGQGTIDTAVDCMRRGAFDFLCKPFTDIEKVRGTVSRALVCARPAPGPLAAAVGSADWTRVPLTGEPTSRSQALTEGVPLSLDAYMRLALERALREAGGDAREAARRLGIGRSTFYRKAAKLGIDLGRFDDRAEGNESPAPRLGGGPSIG